MTLSRITHDSAADGPSVLQVRCLNVLPEAIGTLVLSLLKTYGAEIEKGRWWSPMSAGSETRPRSLSLIEHRAALHRRP